MPMLEIDNIVRIALRETDADVPNAASYTKAVNQALEKPDEIPVFSSSSRPLDVVRFRCLLQDTGYPAEVYLPEDAGEKVDWSKLKERWVGWAVQVPGEQGWARLGTDIADQMSSLSIAELPPPVKGKYPLEGPYTGALLKVYDTEASFSPASAYEVIGIVSTAALPTSLDEEGDGEPQLVPAIHVLLPPTPAFPAPSIPENAISIRDELVAHLANAFSPPDAVAAELLLLALIAYPASRRGGMPLGVLSLNLIRPAGKSALIPLIESLVPVVISLEITLPLLHSATFSPASEGSSLTPGLLQLAPGTLLVIDEDGLGDGGSLAEKAVRNVQALNDALSDQSVKYMYPYTDGVRIECALRSVITSEGKSLLPSDVAVPVTLSGSVPQAQNIEHFRSYLASVSSVDHADKLSVPDAVGEAIQEYFVADRRAGGSGSVEAAEARLRRRMKIARLMATSYPSAELTKEVWERTVSLDSEVERRLKERDDKRRETNLGAPTATFNGTMEVETVELE